jgi:hypothetical protein
MLQKKTVQEPVIVQKTTNTSLGDVKNLNVATVSGINAKLEQANVFINSFDYENARNVYNTCMQAYAQSSFKNSKEKNELRVMLNHLYLKLTVYRTIYASRKHVTSGNFALMQKDVDIINKIYRKLYEELGNVEEEYKDSEQKFIDYIINSKRHLEESIS